LSQRDISAIEFMLEKRIPSAAPAHPVNAKPSANPIRGPH
jgi:hypothetical protein